MKNLPLPINSSGKFVGIVMGDSLKSSILGSWGLRNLILGLLGAPEPDFFRFLGPRNLNFKVPGAEKANFVGPGGPGGLGIPRHIDLNLTIPTDVLK